MPSKEDKFCNLQQLLDHIKADCAGERVSVGALMDSVGRRSFGPLLLLAGLVTVAPLIGDIPGVPTFIAIFVLLVSVQLLTGAEHFWLPNWLHSRSISTGTLSRALSWLHKPAGWIDRLIKPRWQLFINDATIYLVAVLCILIALVMPLMEFIPFSANLAGAALVCFGLALVARDGLLMLVSILLTGGVIWVVWANL